MIKLISALGAVTLLAGCSVLDLPVVDLEGKDPVQTNRDMSACQIVGASGGWGNPIATCMVNKGYTLLGVYASYNKHNPDSSKVVMIPE